MLEALTRGFGRCGLLSAILICFSFFRGPMVGRRCRMPLEAPPAPLLWPSSLVLCFMPLRTDRVLDRLRSIVGCEAVPWGGSEPPGG